MGLYYEIEDTKACNTINFNNVDTLITLPSETTNKLRWELRPTLVWQPTDKYRLKVKSYFKFPFKFTDRVSVDEITDEKIDLFIDLKSSFEINPVEDFTVGLEYRLLYDFAPRRKFLVEMSDNPVLLVGQNWHSTFGLSLKFEF